MNIGIWIRVSTTDQAAGESPSTHLERAKMYAGMKGWHIAETYDLSGVSGKSIIDHPTTQKMLTDISSGRIEALIFSRLARLARNVKELLEIAEVFKKHNAALVSLGESIDTSSPAGMLLFTVLGALAEWERNEISARVAASVPIRASQGKPTGGIGPWGYKWDGTESQKKLIIDDNNADHIRAIFQIFIEEMGNKSRTAKRLNAMGLFSRQGTKWTITNISRITDNPVYSGKRVANYSKSTGDGKHWVKKPESEWVYHEVEPIISNEVWEQVKSLKETRRSGYKLEAPAKEAKYIFSGILRCSCSNKMYPSHRSQQIGIIYRCRKCGYRYSEPSIEKLFHEVLSKIIITPEMLESEGQILQNSSTLSDRLNLLTNEILRLENKRKRLLDLYSDGAIDKSVIRNSLDEYALQIEQLIAEKLELTLKFKAIESENESRTPLLKFSEKLSNIWGKLTYHEKMLLTHELVDRIDLSDQEVSFRLFWLPEICKELHTPAPAATWATAATNAPAAPARFNATRTNSPAPCWTGLTSTSRFQPCPSGRSATPADPRVPPSFANGSAGPGPFSLNALPPKGATG